MRKTAYHPRPDSIASQCIGFFRHNPDEVLTLEDITEKFDCVRGNIHTLLRPALDAGLLARKEDGELGYVYSAGKDLARWTPADETPNAPTAVQTVQLLPTAATERKTNVSKMLDFDSLSVEDGVPYIHHAPKGQTKWLPLFDKLKKPGQSLQIPGHMRSAVAAAAYKHNKLKCGTFKVAMTSKTAARVWRIA